MTGMLLNNTFYYFEINNELSYTFDFIIGNSIVCILKLKDFYVNVIVIDVIAF